MLSVQWCRRKEWASTLRIVAAWLTYDCGADQSEGKIMLIVDFNHLCLPNFLSHCFIHGHAGKAKKKVKSGNAYICCRRESVNSLGKQPHGLSEIWPFGYCLPCMYPSTFDELMHFRWETVWHDVRQNEDALFCHSYLAQIYKRRGIIFHCIKNGVCAVHTRKAEILLKASPFLTLDRIVRNQHTTQKSEPPFPLFIQFRLSTLLNRFRNSFIPNI